VRERPGVAPNRHFRRDLFNIVVGIVWQTSLTATGIFLVLQDWPWLGVCVGLVAVTSAILKRTWYDRLEDYPADLPAEERIGPEKAGSLPAPAPA
ncbi:MAG: sodium:solute symporter, partial [Gemmatimonadota bacterium]